MMALTYADTLTVHHHDDTVTVHDGGVEYHLSPDQVTVFNQDGQLLAEHLDVLHTDAYKAAR
jgi:hypothetical protein